MNRYKDWFEQAQRDFGKAKLDVKNEFYDWACFTSQQAAEKAVKALCMKLKFDVWGHSITNILQFLKEKINIPEKIIELAQLLDTYYIPTRYPNGFVTGKPADYYNKKMAEEAINACDEIIRFCESYINK